MMGAPLVAAHPAPLNIAAMNSCHGSPANDQKSMPITSVATPAWVVVAMPKRRWASGKRATRTALTREMHRYGARNDGNRPASLLMQYVEEDRWTVVDCHDLPAEEHRLKCGDDHCFPAAATAARSSTIGHARETRACDI